MTRYELLLVMLFPGLGLFVIVAGLLSTVIPLAWAVGAGVIVFDAVVAFSLLEAIGSQS